MKNITKNELIASVKNLNAIIDFIDVWNCYDKVIQFFKITSELQDHSEDIKNLLPTIEGTKILGIKSKRRKITEINRFYAEKEINEFLFLLKRTSLDHIERKAGEKITKENIYFGNIAGIKKLDIKTLEGVKNIYVQRYVRAQITTFVQSFQYFSTSWLY